MVVVCSVSEREKRRRRGKNKDEDKKEQGDLEDVKVQEKEVENDTEVEEETTVEKLSRCARTQTVWKFEQDEKEEELFRIIQEIREELSRRVQEKKAKLLSWGTRVDRLELWTIMMPLLRASTVNRAVQRRKSEKRRKRNTSAKSSNNVRLGTSDPEKQKGLQGQTIVSRKSTNFANTSPCTKDQGNRSVLVADRPQHRRMHARNRSRSRHEYTPTRSVRGGTPRTCGTYEEHRPQQRRNERFPDTFGAVDITGPDMKGLFLIILLVSFMTLSSGQSHERPTYCHVDQEPINREWKLSCQFPVDISERRNDFQVFQLKLDGSLDLVVDGTWIEDEPIAYTAEGYDVDGPVSDQLVIRVQNNVVHSGQVYICTFPSTPLEHIKTCQVPKKEAPLTTMLNTLPAVHNGAWRSVNYEKILLLITAAITYGIICRHV